MIEIPKPKIKGYAIYDPGTDHWSRGGMGPSWGKSPKFWDLGPLKNHLNQFVYRDYKFKPDPDEIEREYVIRKDYAGCVIYDVNKQSILEDFRIEDYLICTALAMAYERYDRKSKRAIKNMMYGTYYIMEPETNA